MNKMKCNACWRELEGQAVSTICGHLICTDDVERILNNDGACPICDQVLLKSHMRTVDLNPTDDWTNMAMAGISPPTLINSAYRSVMFFISQKGLEMQYKLNRIVGQCRHKCELMQAEFNNKLEEVHTAYQKMSERCQLMQQEIENLTRDKQKLQEEFLEKSSQKRKLDGMYDELRSKYQCAKYLGRMPQFQAMHSIIDGGTPLRQGSVDPPETAGKRQEGWGPPPRQRCSTSGPFEMSAGSGPPVHAAAHQADMRTRQPAQPAFRAPMNNPSTALRNLIISPDKRPQLSRDTEDLFSARRPPPFHCEQHFAFQPSNNNYLGRMPQFQGMSSIMDGGTPLRQGNEMEKSERAAEEDCWSDKKMAGAVQGGSRGAEETDRRHRAKSRRASLAELGASKFGGVQPCRIKKWCT